MFKFNIFTKNFDMVDSSIPSGVKLDPQTGSGTPETFVTTRKIGDEYIDTAANPNKLYENPNASGNIGRLLMGTMPA